MEEQEVFSFYTSVATTSLAFRIDQWLKSDPLELPDDPVLFGFLSLLLEADLLGTPLQVEYLTVVLHLQHLLKSVKIGHCGGHRSLVCNDSTGVRAILERLLFADLGR